jgi:hypothetical protein
MSNNTIYFPHDCHARNDRKIVNLIMKHGMEGVGIFWCLVEMLYEEGGSMPLEYERITFELRTEINVLRSVIDDFELFISDGSNFSSEAVNSRLSKIQDKSEKARNSVGYRWGKRDNTNVLRTQYEGNTTRNTKKEIKGKEIKEIKVKEVKKERISTTPSIEEVLQYCLERSNKVDGNKWHDYYSSNGWMVGKNKMRDWKAAVRTWEKNNYGGSGNGTGNYGSTGTATKKAGRAESDGKPYPVDHTFGE